MAWTQPPSSAKLREKLINVIVNTAGKKERDPETYLYSVVPAEMFRLTHTPNKAVEEEKKRWRQGQAGEEKENGQGSCLTSSYTWSMQVWKSWRERGFAALSSCVPALCMYGLFSPFWSPGKCGGESWCPPRPHDPLCPIPIGHPHQATDPYLLL